MQSDADLRAAVRRGLVLLRVPELDGGASLRGRVLRFDPDLPSAERARAVLAILRALKP